MLVPYWIECLNALQPGPAPVAYSPPAWYRAFFTAPEVSDMTRAASKLFPRGGFARMAVAAAACLVAACATSPHRIDRIAKVNPASIASAPATWDGRQVEIVGLVVWEAGNLGLYQSYGAYCRRAELGAIHARWQEWPGVTQKDSRRRAIVRGVFRNRVGVKQPDGSTVTSADAPGPGPLEPGMIVWWLSEPQRPCPNRQ